MARARVKITPWGERQYVQYTLYDNEGRVISTDGTGFTRAGWLRLLKRAERDVAALGVVEHLGNRIQYTWGEVVDMAEDF